MRLPLSSVGSVAIEIALGVLVVVLGGYAVYEAHVAHTNKPTLPKATTTPTSPSPTVYRVPELGFEMTLPPGLTVSDLYYVADTTPQTYTTIDGSPYTVRAAADFSTHSLVAQEPTCAPSLSDTGGRGLDSMEIVDLNPMSGAFEEPDLSTQLSSSSWLTLDAKQAPCSQSGPNATLELQQFGLLERAFKTAQPL